jgi:hypothetical protein
LSVPLRSIERDGEHVALTLNCVNLTPTEAKGIDTGRLDFTAKTADIGISGVIGDDQQDVRPPLLRKARKAGKDHGAHRGEQDRWRSACEVTHPSHRHVSDSKS